VGEGGCNDRRRVALTPNRFRCGRASLGLSGFQVVTSSGSFVWTFNTPEIDEGNSLNSNVQGTGDGTMVDDETTRTFLDHGHDGPVRAPVPGG
jgi:hypothetical protein